MQAFTASTDLISSSIRLHRPNAIAESANSRRSRLVWATDAPNKGAPVAPTEATRTRLLACINHIDVMAENDDGLKKETTACGATPVPSCEFVAARLTHQIQCGVAFVSLVATYRYHISLSSPSLRPAHIHPWGTLSWLIIRLLFPDVTF